VPQLSCETCRDTGFEIVSKDGREFAKPCACRRPTGSERRDLVSESRIPPRYEECEFSSFEAGTPALRTALERCLRFCGGYPHLGTTEEGLGLLFTGDNGVGKTHLAVAVLHELSRQKGARGQFWDFQELLREIRNSYNPETKATELEVLAPVVETDLLVLDDLGAWKMTDWMNDTLFYILNSRYLAKRSTIITTNYQDVDREAALAADHLRRKEFLVERIGQRLRSRLMEMCLVIKVEGTDYRQARQASTQVAARGLVPSPPDR
jgi:DNA replication protein DnaC